MAGSEEGPLKVPCPIGHAVLAGLAVAPIFLPVPVNFNIVATAAATVYVGSRRSVKDSPPQDSMTKRDAAKFPLIGSVVLFSLFLAFKYLPKDWVNAVLAAYFVLLGLLALTATADPLVAPFLPRKLSETQFHFTVMKIPVLLKEGLEFSFSPLEIVLSAAAALFSAWYLKQRHWFASNVLGLAFSLQGIEHLSLGSVAVGVILLAGLFFYDIFWVFFTPVMVSVAKNFDAPIKLLFPRFLQDAEGKEQFSMLGLGDIVIPGIFVAIVLRYDIAHGRQTRFFRSSFLGYVVGLTATIMVMNAFKAAQPALLYIVPSVFLFTLAAAALKGKVSHLLYWQEAPKEEEEEEKKEN
ncbi:PSL1 [Auxenochlorella protothecoides x Auxenochlorella symbiontica]